MQLQHGCQQKLVNDFIMILLCFQYFQFYLSRSFILQSWGYYSSRYLFGNFQSNVGCFDTRKLVFVTSGTSLVVLTAILVSLTAIIAALPASIAAFIIACFMYCADIILSWFSEEAFLECGYFLPMSLPCVRLFLLLLIPCNVTHI